MKRCKIIVILGASRDKARRKRACEQKEKEGRKGEGDKELREHAIAGALCPLLRQGGGELRKKEPESAPASFQGIL